MLGDDDDDNDNDAVDNVEYNTDDKNDDDKE